MEATKESIIEIIKEAVGESIDAESLEENAPLTDQGVDSLDRTSIFLAIEEKYDIIVPDEDYNKLQSISDILTYLKDK